MMYRHTMTVYNVHGALVKTIPDSVDLAVLGYPGHAGLSRGVPVEGAVSPDHRYFDAVNYSMYGSDFGPEGSDDLRGPGGLSPSFVYRIDLRTLSINGVTQVGMVPEFVAVTPDNRYVLVTNWCSSDLTASRPGDVQGDPLASRSAPIRVWIGKANKSSSVANIAGNGLDYISARLTCTIFAAHVVRNVVGLSPCRSARSRPGVNLYATLNGETVARPGSATRRPARRIARIVQSPSRGAWRLSADGHGPLRRQLRRRTPSRRLPRRRT